MKPPYAIGSVPSLSGHAVAYRWRSLPRVRRHTASKPQGGSERVLPWQITMDQLIFASLSYTHYWYEVGMLKVPAWTSSVPWSRPSPNSRPRYCKNGVFVMRKIDSSLKYWLLGLFSKSLWLLIDTRTFIFTRSYYDGWELSLKSSPSRIDEVVQKVKFRASFLKKLELHHQNNAIRPIVLPWLEHRPWSVTNNNTTYMRYGTSSSLRRRTTGQPQESQ